MPSRSPSAGGAPIALGSILGAAIGFVVREPTICFLAGFSIGCLIAVLIWWRGR